MAKQPQRPHTRTLQIPAMDVYHNFFSSGLKENKHQVVYGTGTPHPGLISLASGRYTLARCLFFKNNSGQSPVESLTSGTLARALD